MKKVQIPDIGTRFEFPDVEATGLVVAHHEGVPLSYFFPFGHLACPDSELSPENAILVAWHNLVPYFINRTITHQHVIVDFEPTQWPWPIPITSTEWGRGRCIANLMRDPRSSMATAERVPITPEAARSITSDEGYHSLGNVAECLRRILACGEAVAGRTYTLPDPMPDGGVLLERYMRLKVNSDD